MEGYYKFENLDTWQFARKFLQIVYTISKNFPADERFGLTSQIRRASLSIMLNIAEGSQRYSDNDFKRFLTIAYGSLLEVVSCCYTAKDLNYINSQQFNYLYTQSHIIAKKIQALRRALNKY